MEQIEEFLKQRRKSSLLRVLHPADSRKEGKIYLKGKEYIDLCSNDYLGLSAHPALREASIKATEKFGVSASGSRLLSGDLDIHHKLEEKVAMFKGKEAALVFNSGYQANLGIISSLYRKGDVIFSDRLNHASIVDGMLLSGARFFRFQHNDTKHLELLLKKERNKFSQALIITETIFSMDGDIVPLNQIVKLKQKYNCQLMVDEAHATGIFGSCGTGVVEEKGLTGEVDLIMGTFSKALGSFGAYLGCSRRIKEYLVNSCRSFIYSTALPASVIAANLVSLELIKKEPFRRSTLLDNADYFRRSLKQKGFQLKGVSQIVPLIIGQVPQTISLSKALKDKGYWVLPIRPPTVPSNEARLRFSLTYYHNKEILTKLINDISEFHPV